MPRRTCPQCNAEVRPRVDFCIRCGYRFPPPDGPRRQGPLDYAAWLIIALLLVAIVVLTVLERIR